MQILYLTFSEFPGFADAILILSPLRIGSYILGAKYVSVNRNIAISSHYQR